MPNFLVRVHDAPRDVSFTRIHDVSEYEIEAAGLREACEMVLDKPVRTVAPVQRMHDQHPGHRDYVEPPRSRFHAVADIVERSPASIDKALARSGQEIEARRAVAESVAKRYVMEDAGSILDSITLVDTWDDPEADHTALLKAWIEKEWYPEEPGAVSWHDGLHEALGKAGVDGPLEREAAEATYWESVRGLVAERNADRAAPAP